MCCLAGAHWTKTPEQAGKIFKLIARAIKTVLPTSVVVFRSNVMGHNGCHKFSKPSAVAQGTQYNWRDFGAYNSAVIEAFEAEGVANFFMMDLSMYEQRGDGHVTYGDCLHYCTPGPPDLWNQQILFHILGQVAAADRVHPLATPAEHQVAAAKVADVQVAAGTTVSADGEALDKPQSELQPAAPPAALAEQLPLCTVTHQLSRPHTQYAVGRWEYRGDHSVQCEPVDSDVPSFADFSMRPPIRRGPHSYCNSTAAVSHVTAQQAAREKSLYNSQCTPERECSLINQSEALRVTESLAWQWQPDGCAFHPFDRQRLAELLGAYAPVMVVGDSISTGQAESLACMLEHGTQQVYSRREDSLGIQAEEIDGLLSGSINSSTLMPKLIE